MLKRLGRALSARINGFGALSVNVKVSFDFLQKFSHNNSSGAFKMSIIPKIFLKAILRISDRQDTPKKIHLSHKKIWLEKIPSIRGSHPTLFNIG